MYKMILYKLKTRTGFRTFKKRLVGGSGCFPPGDPLSSGYDMPINIEYCIKMEFSRNVFIFDWVISFSSPFMLNL